MPVVRPSPLASTWPLSVSMRGTGTPSAVTLSPTSRTTNDRLKTSLILRKCVLVSQAYEKDIVSKLEKKICIYPCDTMANHFSLEHNQLCLR